MKDRRRKSIRPAVRVAIAIVLGAALTLAATAASVPTVINYQGRLTDNTPQQVPVNAVLPMEFRIFGSLNGPDLQWVENRGPVPIVNGIFNVLLGTLVPIPENVFTSDDDRYLEIVVNGEVLAPRQRIASVGYAYQTEMSADLTCVDCVDSTEVSFNFAASSSRGGPATDLQCTNCVDANEVQFSYAASTSEGGPATGLSCTGCVSSAMVGFNYANSTSKGGAATDLACTDCVSSGEVQFNYAASTAEAGAASDLACTNCVVTGEITDGTIVDADISATAAINPAKISGTGNLLVNGTIASTQGSGMFVSPLHALAVDAGVTLSPDPANGYRALVVSAVAAGTYRVIVPLDVPILMYGRSPTAWNVRSNFSGLSAANFVTRVRIYNSHVNEFAVFTEDTTDLTGAGHVAHSLNGPSFFNEHWRNKVAEYQVTLAAGGSIRIGGILILYTY